MDTCPDCTQVKASLADNPDFQLIDIGRHVGNLKAFLRLRDSNPAFDTVKSHGLVGIPCFVLEDGSVLFEMDGVFEGGRQEAASCNLNGKGC